MQPAVGAQLSSVHTLLSLHATGIGFFATTHWPSVHWPGTQVPASHLVPHTMVAAGDTNAHWPLVHSVARQPLGGANLSQSAVVWQPTLSMGLHTFSTHTPAPHSPLVAHDLLHTPCEHRPDSQSVPLPQVAKKRRLAALAQLNIAVRTRAAAKPRRRNAVDCTAGSQQVEVLV